MYIFQQHRLERILMGSQFGHNEAPILFFHNNENAPKTSQWGTAAVLELQILIQVIN